MALSVRLDPDLESVLELEVQRRGITKSQFVNDVLRQALKPVDPMWLLEDIRREHGLPVPTAQTPRTERSRGTSAAAREAVKARRGGGAG